MTPRAHCADRAARAALAVPATMSTTLLALAGAATIALWLPVAHPGLHDDTGPLPVLDGASAPPVGLACQVRRGERGSVVQLGNDTQRKLPRGTRIAWATTGTPAAQGQWHWLAQSLAPRQGLSIVLSTVLHGSGCVATLLH